MVCAFKHRVENLSDAPYDAVYIGVKSVGTKSAAQNQLPDLPELQMAKLRVLLAAREK